MTLAVSLLRLFSRPAQMVAAHDHRTEVSLSQALTQLQHEFGDLTPLLQNKKVLDFGSGYGLQAIAVAQQYAAQVVGLEINPKHVAQSRENQHQLGAQHLPLRFLSSLDQSEWESFDVVISQNAFEHFSDPKQMLTLMRRYLKPDGQLLISFGPPWLAPHGSHMSYFCRLPWVNVFFSEQTVMQVRAEFRNDGARFYCEIESGLNQMTVSRFERLLRDSGLRIHYQHYTCVKRWNWLARLPWLREFFINQVSVSVTQQ